MLQIVSLFKWFFHPIFNHLSLNFIMDLLGCKLYHFFFDNWHLDELKVSFDDNVCKLIHRKCH